MNLFDYFFGRCPGRVASRHTSAKLTLENLENRCVPATLVGQLDLGIDPTVQPIGPENIQKKHIATIHHAEDPQATLIFKGMGVYKNVDQQTGETAMLLPAVQKVNPFASADSEDADAAFGSGGGAGKVQQIDIHFAASPPDEEAVIVWHKHVAGVTASLSEEEAAVKGRHIVLSGLETGDGIPGISMPSGPYAQEYASANPDEPNFMLLPAVQKLTAKADADVAAVLYARKAGYGNDW